MQPDPIPQVLLTYKQAAKVLGCSDKTVWSLCKSGELPAVRFGGNVRIDPRDLEEFIQRSKATPAMTKLRQGAGTKGGGDGDGVLKRATHASPVQMAGRILLALKANQKAEGVG